MLADHISATPVWQRAELDSAQARMWFKMENLMPEVFAFKVRGAMFAALSLSAQERQGGIVTHSSGNHGAAVAWAAAKLGISAYIAVPHTISKTKLQNIQQHGAQIVMCEPAERDAAAQKLVETTGGTFVHPYENLSVITGQATAAREFLQQQPNLEAVVVPVGGGGLLAGTLLAAKHFAPGLRVIAGEPMAADDAYRSMKSGKLENNVTTDTVADGLRATHLGQLNFEIIKGFAPEIVRVEEAEILEAQAILQNRLGVPVEPSSAVAYAAVLKSGFRGNIGVILTGGNVAV